MRDTYLPCNLFHHSHCVGWRVRRGWWGRGGRWGGWWRAGWCRGGTAEGRRRIGRRWGTVYWYCTTAIRGWEWPNMLCSIPPLKPPHSTPIPTHITPTNISTLMPTHPYQHPHHLITQHNSHLSTALTDLVQGNSLDYVHLDSLLAILGLSNRWTETVPKRFVAAVFISGAVQ